MLYNSYISICGELKNIGIYKRITYPVDCFYLFNQLIN